jgi:hypothetical protein
LLPSSDEEQAQDRSAAPRREQLRLRLPGQAGLDAESGAGGDHRRLAGVDGGDDLGVIDPLKIAAQRKGLTP